MENDELSKSSDITQNLEGEIFIGQMGVMDVGMASVSPVPIGESDDREQTEQMETLLPASKRTEFMKRGSFNVIKIADNLLRQTYVYRSKEYFFILTTKQLFCFEDKEDICPFSVVDVERMVDVEEVKPTNEEKKNKVFRFTLSTEDRIYFYSCDNDKNRSSWVKALKKAIRRLQRTLKDEKEKKTKSKSVEDGERRVSRRDSAMLTALPSEQPIGDLAENFSSLDFHHSTEESDDEDEATVLEDSPVPLINVDKIFKRLEEVEDMLEETESADVVDILQRDETVPKTSFLRVYLRDGTHHTLEVSMGISVAAVVKLFMKTFHLPMDERENYRLFLQKTKSQERIMGERELPCKIQMDLLRLSGRDFCSESGMYDHSSLFKYVLSDMPMWLGEAQQAGELNLSNRGLTQFPSTVLRAKKLKSLVLRQNKVVSFPPDLSSLQSLTKLHLVRNQLTFLPLPICTLPSLVELDLGNNLLTTLPPEMAAMTKLRDLFLYVNCFTEIPPVLSQLKLRTLSMTSNRITAIPDHFQNLTSIVELRLASNFIKEIPSFFGTFSFLFFLDLRANLIDEVPPELVECKNLHTLSIRKNNVKELPPLPNLDYCLNAMENDFEAIPRLSEKLRIISFKECKLKELPMTLELPKLVEINMSDNDLRVLPELTGLPNVRKFNFTNNNLEALPASISTMDSLTELYISGNKISKFPAEIGNCPITKLDAHGNLLEEIPQSLCRSDTIVVMNFSGNKLKGFPIPLTKMSSLKELYLANNRITDGIWTAISDVADNLKFLNLGYNKISKIDPLVLSKLDQLVILTLSGNTVGSLPKEISKLSGLREIYAANCGLTEVPADISQLKELVVIDISLNKLKAVPEGVLALPVLRDLHLAYNKDLTNVPAALAKTLTLRMLELDGTSVTKNNISEKLAHHVHTDTRPASRRFQAACFEMQGRRNHMEDAVAMQGNFMNNENLDYYAVYDGHGGTEVARFVSVALHHNLARHLDVGELSPEKALETATAETVALLRSRKLGLTCGSTSAGCLFTDSAFYFVNTGDARALVSRGGQAIRATFDHKPTLREEEHRIKNIGGFVTEEGRVNGILAVARSLGDFVLSPYVSHDPHINAIPREPKDDYVIICCDGVWDVIEDQEAVDIVLSEKTPAAAAAKLRDLAYAYGSTDNITAMVIKL